MKGNEAAFVVAMVIDTAGRVEMRSVSIIFTAPAAFVASVCDYLSRLRFTPINRANEARRALVVQPMRFGIDGGRWYRQSIDATPVREALRRQGIVDAARQLESMPHCPGT